MKDDAGSIKILCYLGIFILLLFIILPPLFRVIFKEEEPSSPQPSLPTIMNLSCNKTEDFVDYKILTNIDANYYEEKIHDATFRYEVQSVEGALPEDTILLEEYEQFKLINNVDFEENGNVYIIKIDYSKNDFSNVSSLSNHQKVIAEQLDYYTNNAFQCTTTRVQ